MKQPPSSDSLKMPPQKAIELIDGQLEVGRKLSSRIQLNDIIVHDTFIAETEQWNKKNIDTLIAIFSDENQVKYYERSAPSIPKLLWAASNAQAWFTLKIESLESAKREVKRLETRWSTNVATESPPVSMPSPAYCRMCGRNLCEQTNQRICLGCGVKVGVGRNFCPNCGEATNQLAVMCVKCGIMFEKFSYSRKSQGIKSKQSWFSMHLNWTALFVLVITFPIHAVLIDMKRSVFASLILGIPLTTDLEMIFYGLFLLMQSIQLPIYTWILHRKKRGYWWLIPLVILASHFDFLLLLSLKNHEEA